MLRPGGALGLVWNTRDDRVAVGRRARARSSPPRPRGHEADQGVVDRFAEELSADVDVARVRDRPAACTPEDVVAGIATRSYVAVMDDVRRAAFLAAIRELLAAHPDTRGRDLLELPYVTRAYRLTPR